MKIKKIAKFHPVALAALGVFLGRGAQADTILDFETVPVDQPVNSFPGILQGRISKFEWVILSRQ